MKAADDAEASSGFLLRSDLINQRIDFGSREFSLELGHAMFAAGDDLAEFVSRGRRDLLRNQRWAGHEASFGSFAVALGAVLLIDGIRCERLLRFRLLRA